MTTEFRHEIRWIGVVIPAHNEQVLLPASVAAVQVAAKAAPVPVEILVVLDSCTDGSERAAAPAATVRVAAHNVGRARRTGFDHALRQRPEAITDSQSWLATTDADTVVPPDWLVRMLNHAAAGWDAVAGTVCVSDWSDQPASVRDAWEADYENHDHHRHVHGANLGVRADAYRRVGGVPAVGLAEDALLIAALEAEECRVFRAGDLPVITSARPAGRATGGFATYLRKLPR